MSAKPFSDNSIMFEALKEAVLMAFFKQQQFYDPNGYTQTYGGLAEVLVKKIMESPEMTQIVQGVAEDIVKKKPELVKIITDGFEKNVEEESRKYITDNGYRWGRFVEEAVEEVAKPMIEEKIRSDKSLKKAIENKIGNVEYDYDINVTIRVKEKKDA